MLKDKLKALILVGVFFYGFLTLWAVTRILSDRNESAAVSVAGAPLNDSTQAKLTSTGLQRDSLKVLLRAARQLNGTLIAALRIRVAQRETVYLHDTLETIRYADGTRTAPFGDSTAWSVVRGRVTAPPFPAPLSVSYSVTQPPFNPAVGIVRTGNATFAVVSWQGQEFGIEVPYTNIPPKAPRVIPYLRAAWSPTGSVLGGAGIAARVWHFEPFVEVQAQVSARQVTPHVWAGTTYRHR